LVNNFVDKDNQRYATEGDYERVLNKIASQANRIALPIYASLKNKKAGDSFA
jgi:hypothetical protein